VFVKATLMITDSDAIAAVERGDRREVSCGYTCELEHRPGEWNGQRYDAIQRNIRGNHVAIVEKGRAGPEVRLRLDAADNVINPGESPDTSAPPRKESPPVTKIKFDGVEYEASEQVAQLFGKLTAKLDESDKAIKATKTEAEKLQAKADALAEDLKKAEAARKDAADPAKIRAAIDARLDLERKARAVLGAEAKLDTMDEKAIKLAVIAKVSPEFKADGKSDDYVQARFDMALEKGATEGDDLGEARRAAAGESKTDAGDEVDAAAARKRMVEANRNAWKREQPKA
jgi:hypothetical protein